MRECPEMINSKRDLDSKYLPHQLEIERGVLKRLTDALVRCRATNPSMVVTPTKKMLTTQMTTTVQRVPIECLMASNLTDSWRRHSNHNGIIFIAHRIISSLQCDFKRNSNWFRFTGEAGNRLLNTCPQPYSCGSISPYWTDEVMPTEVSKVKLIKVYQSANRPRHLAFLDKLIGPNCKNNTKLIRVMKCPDGRYIYKVQQMDWVSSSCSSTFCGMI